jgi:hypothetical protein
MSSAVWLAVAAAVSAGCLLWLMLDIRRQPLPRVLKFTVYAIFFRFMLSAFHPFTFPAVIGPFSINALYSVVVIGLGFQFIDHRLLRLRFLLPIYGLILLIVISALYNDSLKDSIQSLLKWLFFLVIALAVYESLIRVGRALVLEKLLMCFTIPVTLQLVSVALGYSKVTDNDDSISYIGGYNHEAVFSVMLVTAMSLAAMRQMIPPRAPWQWSFLPLLLAVEVALANYRTNILAMLAPLLGFLYFHFLHKGLPLAKVAAALALMAGAIALATVDFSHVVQRFAEIGTVIDSTTQLIKSPLFYTEWEQDYFSARVYIWSQYIDAYLQADSTQHVIGLGADAWEHQFRKYAHNTFISHLYELGILGCVGIAYIFLRTLLLCLSGPLTTYSAQLLLCFLGFVIMNLGTMPLWQIEGVVLFATLSALAWELKLTSTIKTAMDPAGTDDSSLVGEMAGEPV